MFSANLFVLFKIVRDFEHKKNSMSERDGIKSINERIGNFRVVELFGGRLDTFAVYKIDERGKRIGEEPEKLLNSRDELHEEINRLMELAGGS